MAPEAPLSVAPSGEARIANSVHEGPPAQPNSLQGVPRWRSCVHERCCGLDVHKETVVACVILAGQGRQLQKEIRTFGTMTAELLEFADWLNACGVTHLAMESTGVYWKPVWNLLEGQFELLLVNARHIKQVPGRKTDVKDCEWLA